MIKLHDLETAQTNYVRNQLKVEKILKGSLDLIPSPSKSPEHLNFLFLFFSAKHCWVLSTNIWAKKFVDNRKSIEFSIFLNSVCKFSGLLERVKRNKNVPT